MKQRLKNIVVSKLTSRQSHKLGWWNSLSRRVWELDATMLWLRLDRTFDPSSLDKHWPTSWSIIVHLKLELFFLTIFPPPHMWTALPLASPPRRLNLITPSLWLIWAMLASMAAQRWRLFISGFGAIEAEWRVKEVQTLEIHNYTSHFYPLWTDIIPLFNTVILIYQCWA